MSGTIHKEYRPLAKAARKQGWTIEVSKTCHLKWKSPTGRMVVSSGTPSNPGHSVKELTSQLRKAGLDV